MKLFWLIFIFFIFEVGAKPKISVIIPVYNVERFLRECLDSVLNQTFTDFEVICINDASPDRCLDILQEYADKDKRVRVISHEKNSGVYVARNTGLNAAEGEYISFCDSDDYMHPDMLKIMYTEMRRNNCDLAVCQYYSTNEFDKPTFLKNISYTVSFPKDSLLRKINNPNMFFPLWNKMYKKTAIASFRFDPQAFASDDAFFNIRTFRFVKRCIMTDAKLYGYRQNQDSITKSKSASQAQKRIGGRCKLAENICNSSYDSVPLSINQKRTICCRLAAFAAAEAVFGCFKYETVIYASKQIYDLYSKGFMDISHSEGFLRKILVASFIAIGKIRSWFKVS
ncbi:MAG: glycosyltransferase [Holosporaceae bacterium]|jgi:glycosyltransferase involved in cell wall biosynthesis|nr:glycosyltransferase [Holosporaceae bacterium]